MSSFLPAFKFSLDESSYISFMPAPGKKKKSEPWIKNAFYFFPLRHSQIFQSEQSPHFFFFTLFEIKSWKPVWRLQVTEGFWWPRIIEGKNVGLEQKREARKDLLHEIYSLSREDLERTLLMKMFILRQYSYDKSYNTDITLHTTWGQCYNLQR